MSTHKEANETVGTANPLMSYYIGTKEILARPITKGEYNAYRGWETPENEDPKELGYLVEYLDSNNSNHENHKGYISWSPAVAFRAAYKNNERLTFGHAIVALKQGKRVQRAGWNGKGLFIFMQVPSQVDKEIVPKMTSLPQSVKNEFQKRFDGPAMTDGKIKYQNQIAMVYPDNNIYGWVASPSDILEEDWIILD